jgi:hypothetical protein
MPASTVNNRRVRQSIRRSWRLQQARLVSRWMYYIIRARPTLARDHDAGVTMPVAPASRA